MPKFLIIKLPERTSAKNRTNIRNINIKQVIFQTMILFFGFRTRSSLSFIITNMMIGSL